MEEKRIATPRGTICVVSGEKAQELKMVGYGLWFEYEDYIIVSNGRNAYAVDHVDYILHFLRPDLWVKEMDAKKNCKVGNFVYHIDAEYHIWEYQITEINDEIVFVLSNDDLRIRNRFVLRDMPMPRLYFTKEAAVEVANYIKTRRTQ